MAKTNPKLPRLLKAAAIAVFATFTAPAIVYAWLYTWAGVSSLSENQTHAAAGLAILGVFVTIGLMVAAYDYELN